MPIQVIVWTCVVVFVMTAAITLLGITNRISIDKAYLNALFTALILEIAAIGIAAFKSSMHNDAGGPFVRVTYPISDVSVGTQGKMYVAGVAVVGADQHLVCGISTQHDTIVYSQIQLKPKGFFDLAYDLSNRTFPLATNIACTVYQGDRVVIGDTSRVSLTRGMQP
jgi:hypothetical protein